MPDRISSTADCPKTYTVSFFKILCNDTGRESRVCQKAIRIQARSPEAAAEAARAQFIRTERAPPSIFSCLDMEVAAD